MNDSPSEPPVHETPSREAPAPDWALRRIGRKASAAHIVFGVALPVITLLVEVFTRAATEYFDTMPTWWHALMIAAVPLSNALVLLHLRRDASSDRMRRWLPWLNAFSIGVASYYTVAFLPLMPFAVIGILFFGFGLIPLAPFTSLLSAALLRRRMNHEPGVQLVSPKLTRWGMAIGVGCVVWISVSHLITDAAVSAVTRADSNRPSTAALAWLRSAADQHHLYDGATDNRRTGGFWQLFREIGVRRPFENLTPADYKIAIYRATGLPVSRIARSGSPLGRLGRDTGADEWEWDESLGEQRTGQRLRALFLTDSRIDGTVDPSGAVGYTEWTLVFRNDHKFQQREARALVQLPAGGVVSRLTLWINGEPCEAAFGGTAQVTQAYKAVVNQRRDPVLVTHAGADQILMQCFPVPPRGGEMKVRLGITYPLALSADGAASGALPTFVEQNFSTRDSFSHAVWINSSAPLSASHPGLAVDAAGDTRLHGSISAADFSAGSVLFRANRSAADAVWADDPHEPTRKIVQRFSSLPARSAPLTIVVDGSVHMRATGLALANALASLPSATPVNVFFAGDELRQPPRPDAATAADWLREQPFVGGQDNTLALTRAYDAVAGQPDAAILWIHGPQPVTWHDTGPLLQRVQRAPGAVALIDYSTGFGASPRLLEIADAAAIQRLNVPALAHADLATVLRNFSAPRVVVERMIEKSPSPPTANASDHVARLWAKDEVAHLIAQRTPSLARELAIKAQLVTPITGAVVLETKAQYAAAGLTPVDSSTTPAIPEPATFAVLMGASILAFTLVKRRRPADRRSVAASHRGGSR